MHELIHAIYSAGADASEWPLVLKLLADYLHGAAAAIHLGDTDGSGFSLALNHNHDPDALAAYAAHYYKINPLNPPLLKVAAGTAIGHHQLVRYEEYRNSAFRYEYGQRYDLGGSITAVLANSNGQLTCLGVTNTYGDEPFADEDIAKAQALVPHLQRALDLNRKIANLENARSRSEEAVEQLSLGVVYLASGAKVVYTNECARRSLARSDGLAIRNGRLVSSSRSPNEFEAMIAKAISLDAEAGGTMAVDRGEGRRPLMVRVVPLRKAILGSADAKVAVFLRDPEVSSASSVEAVAKLYGLTPAEARVVSMLVDAPDVGIVADQLSISAATVRNHLARALSKTQTSKQAELIALLLQSTLPLR